MFAAMFAAMFAVIAVFGALDCRVWCFGWVVFGRLGGLEKFFVIVLDIFLGCAIFIASIVCCFNLL